MCRASTASARRRLAAQTEHPPRPSPLAAKEEGAQIAAELGLPEPAARKASFPTDPVAQTAAVFAALAAARGPTDAATIAAGFRKTKTSDRSDVLAALARLGHAATHDGKSFELRRAA